MKKKLSSVLLVIFTLIILSGCTNKEKNTGVVHISILNSKPEIQVALEDATKEFSKENPNIKIKVVKYNRNETYYNKLMSMYSYENAPTMTIGDPTHIKNIKNNLLDLSSEEWVKDVSGGISNIAKNESGEVIGFPFATEGVGFIYNKKVIEEAGIDVSSINTIKSLEEAFKKVEAIGKKGVIVTNEKWSLGDHFLSTAYSAQSKDTNDIIEYIENVKKGTLNVKDNAKLNGLLDTFDLMKKYNIYKDEPLTPSYDKCAEVLGKGDVGFWYMGNWASKSILDSSKDNKDYGFIPVPISNDSSEYGNNEITLGVTKYIVVDKSNSSKEQQDAAKKFLNWVVYTKEGQEFVVNKSGIISAFANNEIKQADPLANDIMKYKEKEKAMELMNSYLPENNSENVGVALRKYLSSEIDRNQLLNIIQEYWENQK
ncbi:MULTISPECIES: ABC transporter substrate-binding protein [Clostridium]|uniref:Carbohydrate ABC transporter substrate-binding protein n=1 Tax=Clostridium cibarium TaxID=2762247 RepID=A0ABR8PVP1_9CLOT|nr:MULTISPECIES: ABC transporter substrate-binding protein [Clostridium]MBD7912253.1 carbohydrate ABC transporter substrate-binding protein [Clostridium cibarium]